MILEKVTDLFFEYSFGTGDFPRIGYGLSNMNRYVQSLKPLPKPPDSASDKRSLLIYTAKPYSAAHVYHYRNRNFQALC